VISPWRIAVSVSALSGNWSHGGPPRSRWTTAIAVDHHGLGGSRWNTCATTTLYKCTVCNIELYMFIHIADRIMLFFFKLCMYMYYMPFIIKSPNVQPFSLVFALFTESLTCLTSSVSIVCVSCFRFCFNCFCMKFSLLFLIKDLFFVNHSKTLARLCTYIARQQLHTSMLHVHAIWYQTIFCFFCYMYWIE